MSYLLCFFCVYVRAVQISEGTQLSDVVIFIDQNQHDLQKKAATEALYYSELPLPRTPLSLRAAAACPILPICTCLPCHLDSDMHFRVHPVFFCTNIGLPHLCEHALNRKQGLPNAARLY
jgi:hypothetical protein